MDVTVLGVGAAFPRAGTACSGYLLRTGSTTVWMDAGNGTFSRLQEYVDHHTVDAVLLTHSHADHIADVLPVMYARAFDKTVTEKLTVYAPPDVEQRFKAFLGNVGRELFDATFDVRPLSGPIEVGDLRFEPFRTVHPVETYGLRVRHGGSLLAYTADTGRFPELADHCRAADLFITEATYVSGHDGDASVHMWASEAGEVAAEADARHVLVTHVWGDIPPEVAVAEAAQAFDGRLEAAEEGKTYTL